jgi:hypothetical protein
MNPDNKFRFSDQGNDLVLILQPVVPVGCTHILSLPQEIDDALVIPAGSNPAISFSIRLDNSSINCFDGAQMICV